MSEQPTDRGLHRHGEPDPSVWDEQPTVTGRPADSPVQNSTFAERAAARHGHAKAAESKAIEPGEAENKAVTSKKPRRKS